MSFMPMTNLIRMSENVRTLDNLEAGLLAPEENVSVQLRSPNHSQYRSLTSFMYVSVILSTGGFLAAVARYCIDTGTSQQVFDGAIGALFLSILFISLSAIFTAKDLMKSCDIRMPPRMQLQRTEAGSIQTEEVEEAASASDLGSSSTNAEQATTDVQTSTSNACSASVTEVAAAISEIASDAMKAANEPEIPETDAKDGIPKKDLSASDLRRRKLLNPEALATATQSSDEDASK